MASNPEKIRMSRQHRMVPVVSHLLFTLSLFLSISTPAHAQDKKVFKAGAFAIDVSPRKFPVIVNGGMTERTADKLNDPIHARCLVLDDGTTRVAMVVVDS